MGHVDARDSNPTKEIVGDKGDVWVRGLAHIHAGQTLAAQVGDLDAPASKLLRLKLELVHFAIAHLLGSRKLNTSHVAILVQVRVNSVVLRTRIRA